ncbi:MAG: Gfo/Idh/MocA family oxidoreductase [Anaerolineae bacterium]|nr:Gfo/Idh/MocA family oxidoreductase [Anaerolineae bacterium]
MSPSPHSSMLHPRTAVIGAGAMGKRHIQVVRDLGLELVGVCDQRPESLNTAAQEFNLTSAQQFSDAADMLKSVQPELVVVATTTPSHAAFTLAALESSAKYILCEKPMAASLAECDRMIAACEQHGAKLAINHQMRFLDTYQAIKELVYGEAFGGLTSITIVGGNFGMAMVATHQFELLRFMTDEYAAEVSAWFSPEIVANPRGAEFEDRAGSVRAVTSSGKRLYIDAGSDQGHGMNFIFAARYGQIIFDPFAGVLTATSRKAEHRALPTTRYGMPSDHTERRFEPINAVTPTRRVLEALRSDGDYPTGEDGRAALMTLVAAYVSAEQGGIPVAVDRNTLPIDHVFPWA